MHVYLLMGFTFAITASIIAYSKGRNSLGWFLSGFLIGPFALVVAALPPVARDGGVFMRCPACGETIRSDASVCRYCRAHVEADKGGNGATVDLAGK